MSHVHPRLPKRAQNGTSFTADVKVTVNSANTPECVNLIQEPKFNDLLMAYPALPKPRTRNSHVEKLIKRRGWR
jgi:hypothetical protein